MKKKEQIEKIEKKIEELQCEVEKLKCDDGSVDLDGFPLKDFLTISCSGNEFYLRDEYNWDIVNIGSGLYLRPTKKKYC